MVGFTGSIQAPIPGGNTISGNSGTGVSIGGSASGTVLLYNRIGTDGSGTFVNVGLANQGYGVLVDTSASTDSTIAGATIGGTIAVPGQEGALLGSFNVISGNAKGGIELQGTGSNLVAGNLIGTDITGTAALGNGGDGINLVDLGKHDRRHRDGGGQPDLGQLGGRRVDLGGGLGGNDVFGNLIGTDISQSVALGNTGSGIVISGSDSKTIGFAVGSGGNRIAGNQKDGVDIIDSAANTVVANTIGESASALIGNADDGIRSRTLPTPRSAPRRPSSRRSGPRPSSAPRQPGRGQRRRRDLREHHWHPTHTPGECDRRQSRVAE